MSSIPIEFREKPIHLQLKPKFPASLFKSHSEKPQIKLFKSMPHGLPMAKTKRKLSESIFKNMIENKSPYIIQTQEFKNRLSRLISLEKDGEIIERERLLIEYSILNGLYSNIIEMYRFFQLPKAGTFIDFLNIKDELMAILNNLFLLYEKFKDDEIKRDGILSIIYDILGNKEFNSLFKKTIKLKQLIEGFKEDSEYPIFDKILLTSSNVIEILRSIYERFQYLVFDVYFEEINDKKLELAVRMNIFYIIRNFIGILRKCNEKLIVRYGGKLKKILKKRQNKK